jgi:hypothetical protein
MRSAASRPRTYTKSSILSVGKVLSSHKHTSDIYESQNRDEDTSLRVEIATSASLCARCGTKKAHRVRDVLEHRPALLLPHHRPPVARRSSGPAARSRCGRPRSSLVRRRAVVVRLRARGVRRRGGRRCRGPRRGRGSRNSRTVVGTQKRRRGVVVRNVGGARIRAVQVALLRVRVAVLRVRGRTSRAGAVGNPVPVAVRVRRVRVCGGWAGRVGGRCGIGCVRGGRGGGWVGRAAVGGSGVGCPVGADVR